MTREQLSEQYPHLLVMDPEYFDAAILGVVTRINLEAVCYDKAKVIKIIMGHDKMSYEEALEHFDYNIQGAWVGKHTPVFIE